MNDWCFSLIGGQTKKESTDSTGVYHCFFFCFIRFRTGNAVCRSFIPPLLIETWSHASLLLQSSNQLLLIATNWRCFHFCNQLANKFYSNFPFWFGWIVFLLFGSLCQRLYVLQSYVCEYFFSIRNAAGNLKQLYVYNTIHACSDNW